MANNKEIRNERYKKACIRFGIDIDADTNDSDANGSDDGSPNSQRRLPYVEKTDDNNIEPELE